MEDNRQLHEAWDFVEHTGRSIFLTGKAGTGKTTFLKTVVEESTKRTVVVAPTGVAAINAGGMTIHSFFQLPLSPFVPNAKVKNRFDFSKEKRKIIASMDLLIIDEISMVRSDLLDAIDTVLRRFRNRHVPFGGVQLLMIGDLAQLTPVVTAEDIEMLRPYYDTPYFFGSKALSQIDYVTIQLDKVYRQHDEDFLALLNHIRNGHPSSADLMLLNKRFLPTFRPKADEGYIRLTTHNATANSYNESELRKLPSRPYTFDAHIEGTFPEYAYPTTASLVLKEGAQVMFVKNDSSTEHRYYNGRIGHVVEVDDDHVIVRCPGDDEAIEVEPQEWENARYTLNPQTREISTEVLGIFRQLPLRLAWAITIHKSQGLTFERAIIDANQSFAPGQVYVALSRCKTLEGMVLASPIEARAIINDQRVDSYIAQQEQAAQVSIRQLPTLKEEYRRFLILELFNFSDLYYAEEHLMRVLIDAFYRSHNALTDLHKQTLAELKKHVTDVAQKWSTAISRMTIEQLHSPEFIERIRRSVAYFAGHLDLVMDRPVRLCKEVKSGNKESQKRFDNAFGDLLQAWLFKRSLLERMSDVNFTTAVYLHAKQQSQLDAIDGRLPKKGKKERKKREKAQAPKPEKPKRERPRVGASARMDTLVTTLQLFNEGLSAEQIAEKRGLTLTTIQSHLLKLTEQGEVDINDVVDPHHMAIIRQAISRIGLEGGMKPIKEACPDDISYAEIRFAIQSFE